MSFTFRLRFNVSRPAQLAIDANELSLIVTEQGISVKLRAFAEKDAIKESEHLVLLGQGYASEKEASDAGLLFQNALIVTLGKFRVGADFGERRIKPTFVSDGQNVIYDQLGLKVYRTRPGLQFVSVEAELIRFFTPEVFQNELSNIAQLNPSLNERDQLAYRLFHDSFFHPTDLRFLLLFLAVEILIEYADRSREAIDHVNKLIEQTQNSSHLDDEKLSMLGSLGQLKKESIKQAGRRLVAERLNGRSYNNQSAPDFFEYCYKLRNKLAHSKLPVPPFDEVESAATNLEIFVRDLLIIRTVGSL